MNVLLLTRWAAGAYAGLDNALRGVVRHIGRGRSMSGMGSITVPSGLRNGCELRLYVLRLAIFLLYCGLPSPLPDEPALVGLSLK